MSRDQGLNSPVRPVLLATVSVSPDGGAQGAAGGDNPP